MTGRIPMYVFFPLAAAFFSPLALACMMIIIYFRVCLRGLKVQCELDEPDASDAAFRSWCELGYIALHVRRGREPQYTVGAPDFASVHGCWGLSSK